MQLIAHTVVVYSSEQSDISVLFEISLAGLSMIALLSFILVWAYTAMMNYIKVPQVPVTHAQNARSCTMIILTSCLIAYAFYLTTQHTIYTPIITSPSWGL